MSAKRIAVIYGGRSGEHQVSIISASSIIDNLSTNDFSVLPIYIDNNGKWLYPINPKELLDNDNKVDLNHASEVCIVPNPAKKGMYNFKTNTFEKIDVVFPILHGTYGEDGTIQGLLELAGLPYVGAGVLSSAAGMDKATMKAIFAHHHIPQVKFLAYLRNLLEKKENLNAAIKEIETKLGYPCFIKPANLGSSVGINKATNSQQLLTAIEEAFQYDGKIIVEEFVQVREVEVAILGNSDPAASVIGEIVPCNDFYDYKAKYIDNNSKLIIPAQLTDQEEELIQQLAIKAYKSIDCSGLARVDFFITKNEGRVLLNEINTLPGFTAISMYPKLWEATGIKYPDLIKKLIQLAEEKHKEKQKNIVHFKAI